MINFGLDSVDLIYHKHGIQIPNPCQKTSQIEKIVGKLELHYTLEIFFSKLSLRFMFMKSHEKLRFWFKMMIEVQENRNWPKAISRVASRVSGQ